MLAAPSCRNLLRGHLPRSVQTIREDGALLMVNMTNDACSADERAAQHLAMYRSARSSTA